MGAWAGAGYGKRGLVAGLGVGQALLGCSSSRRGEGGTPAMDCHPIQESRNTPILHYSAEQTEKRSNCMDSHAHIT